MSLCEGERALAPWAEADSVAAGAAETLFIFPFSPSSGSKKCSPPLPKRSAAFHRELPEDL